MVVKSKSRLEFIGEPPLVDVWDFPYFLRKMAGFPGSLCWLLAASKIACAFWNLHRNMTSWGWRMSFMVTPLKQWLEEIPLALSALLVTTFVPAKVGRWCNFQVRLAISKTEWELLVASHRSFSGGIFGWFWMYFGVACENSQGLDGWAIDWWLHFHYRTLSAENRNFGGWNHRWTDWISGWLRRKFAWCECSQSLQILESNHLMFDDVRSRYVFWYNETWHNKDQQGMIWHKRIWCDIMW